MVAFSEGAALRGLRRRLLPFDLAGRSLHSTLMRWILALALVVALSFGVERAEAFSMGEGLATTGIQGTLSGNATSGVAGVTKSVKGALPSSAAPGLSIDDGGSGMADAARRGPGGGAKGGSSQARWSGGGNSWATGGWAAGGGGGGSGSGWASGGSWAAGGGWATAGSARTARSR
jgi:hypothetical protein